MRPYAKVTLALSAAVGTALYGASLLRGREDDVRVGSAGALPTLCARTRALAALSPVADGGRSALERTLAESGAEGLTEMEMNRLATFLAEIPDPECPRPEDLRDAKAAFRAIAAPCADSVSVSGTCVDAWTQVFATEPALRIPVGRWLLREPKAVSGRFGTLLLGALNGESASPTPGRAPESWMGMDGLRVLARTWAVQHPQAALSAFAKGGRGLWHEVLGEVVAPELSRLPDVDVSWGTRRQRWKLLRENGESCELVHAPGTSMATVSLRPCETVLPRVPTTLRVADQVGFDLSAGTFVEGTEDSPVPLLRPRVKGLQRNYARTLPGMAERVPEVERVEEWSSAFLPHRVRVVFLPGGAVGGQVVGVAEDAVIIGGGQCLPGPAVSSNRRAVEVLERGVVPGPQGYFLVLGRVREQGSECEQRSEPPGYFALTCRAEGCVSEEWPGNSTGAGSISISG